MATDLIRYDLLVQDALRSVVRRVLAETAGRSGPNRSGLMGDHHFNIAFKTQAPGVIVPASLKARFPDEMSIVLQHEFWDLVVTQEAFEVSLHFSRKAERLTIPFDAITGFTDPSVPFGFKLEPRTAEQRAEAESDPDASPAPRPEPSAPTAVSRTKPEPATPARASSEATGKATGGAGAAKVVSIDAFRKK